MDNHFEMGLDELQRKLLVDNPMRLYWPEG